LPEVSWPFFRAVRTGLAVKRPYLSHTVDPLRRMKNSQLAPSTMEVALSPEIGIVATTLLLAVLITENAVASWAPKNDR
jgi:hypothetical protein